MADRSKIEWTDATWNPVRAMRIDNDPRTDGKKGWHCTHVSEGCRFCYAENFNRRLGTGLDYKPASEREIEIYLDEKMLTQPRRWRKPRRVFVCSMTDLFADFVNEGWIDRMFAVMALCPQHTFQILTKRPERMHRYVLALQDRTLTESIAEIYINEPKLAAKAPLDVARAIATAKRPLTNVWLGTSVENRAAVPRIWELFKAPAAKHFISFEPLLGDIDNLADVWQPGDTLDGKQPCIDWAIVGGESGPNARPMHPDWARRLRDIFVPAGVPFFFKQWGEWLPEDQQEFNVYGGCGGKQGAEVIIDNPTMHKVGKKLAGALLDGREHREFPA